MAWLAINKYGCPIIFPEKPERIGIKLVPWTKSGEQTSIEVPIYSDRETYVPGSVFNISYGGPSEPIDSFTNWAVLPPEVPGTPYYKPLSTGIMIDPETSKKIDPELTWEKEPIEI